MNEHELRSILSMNLKRYRNYRQLSQAELAKKLDISIPFLSDVENGRKWISPLTLVKFATALNVEPYELFKPAEAMSSSMTNVLTEWSDTIIDAVTKTVQNIQGYYLAQSNPPKN